MRPLWVGTSALNEIVVTAERHTASQEYEPDVLVQAGPWLPQWHYHVYDYGWSGPVEASATVRFLVSPPWLTRLWRLLGVAFSGLLLFGINAGRLVSGALQLARRQATQAPGGAALRPEEFPAFVSVRRLFHLRHDWTIDTEIGRIAPKSSAFTLKLPLLPEESVTTPGLESGAGGVTVGLGAAEASTNFSSIIPVSESLELVAANAATYIECWSFDVSSSWHVDFSGIAPVAPAQDEGSWLFEYYPRPGEHLKLTVTRPQAAPGGTLAFDHVDLSTRVGKRSSSSSLQLTYRSTQGGRQVLRLPPTAEVMAVRSDNESLALRPENGELSLSALPGQHTFTIEWQVPAGAAFVMRSPPVDLGAPASNLGIHLGLPQDRWVLYVFGRGVGPTILYWGELIAFIALAWAIGRSRLTSLATRDSLLLGLGLSTFSWLVFGVFVAFIAVFAWRARVAAPVEPRRFNLLQVALALLGIAAVLAVVAAVPRAASPSGHAHHGRGLRRAAQLVHRSDAR